MPEEKSDRIRVLEELVSSTKEVRHFTFEPPINQNDLLNPCHPEFGLNAQVWQVLLGDLGILVCHHSRSEIHKVLISTPNFIELYREFEVFKILLATNGVNATEPVLCWLRGLIHAFMAEKPNVVECNVKMTGTSSTRR